MAKRREEPPVNPLLKKHVAAIVGPARSAEAQAEPGERAGSAGRARPNRPAKASRANGVHVQVKARFTREEAEEIRRFARTLSSYLQATVKGSEVTRALWTLALRSQDQLAQLAAGAPNLDRPSNGDRLAMAQYEDAIAEFLLLALKHTPRG